MKIARVYFHMEILRGMKPETLYCRIALGRSFVLCGQGSQPTLDPSAETI